MSVRIIIDDQDNATLPLRRMVNVIKDRVKLHKAMGFRCGDLTKRYVVEVATPSRHKTADALGAQYSNYLPKAGASVISAGDADGAEISIPFNGAIFKRVAGPVTIRPRFKKLLTIPRIAEAYNKRARELGELQLRIYKDGNGALVRAPKYERKSDGTRRTKDEARAYRDELKAGTVTVFALRKEVTLTEDRDLLPSEAQYFEAMKAATEETLMREIQQSKQGSTGLA